MRGNQADIAITAAVAALACAAAAADAPVAVTIALGLALLAMPGYLLAQLLLGPATAGLERMLVAVGLALIVPVVGGLALYAAGVPLHRTSWLAVFAGVTLVADVALWLRRRTGRSAPFRWPRTRQRLPTRHVAMFGAAVLVAACGVVLARVGAAIQPGPHFTQLWLSSQGVRAGAIKIGVTNDQGSTVDYRLVVLSSGHASTTSNLTLANGATWQVEVPFNKEKGSLTANLYRLPNLSTPYRQVDTNGDKASGL